MTPATKARNITANITARRPSYNAPTGPSPSLAYVRDPEAPWPETDRDPPGRKLREAARLLPDPESVHHELTVDRPEQIPATRRIPDATKRVTERVRRDCPTLLAAGAGEELAGTLDPPCI